MSERKPSESQPGSKICEMDFSSDSGSKELKELVKNSLFVCSGCGRAAASEESLCRPEWIY
jgi:hypothetical protein